MVVLKGEKYQKKMKEQNICSNNNGLLDKLATDMKGKVNKQKSPHPTPTYIPFVFAFTF